MRTPILTALRYECRFSSVSMEQIYDYVGISRQAYFQSLKRMKVEGNMMSIIERWVTNYREQKDRRAGSRSLFYNLHIKELLDIGVTKFEKLMSTHGLTLQPMKIKIVTTNSCFQSWNYKNLTPGLKINDINKLVVGDITYLSIGKSVHYLFCLTDVYSARIVGHCLSKRMRADEAKKCLDIWVELRSSASLEGCIHHTDGGGQYFSNLYLSASQKLKLKTSVSKNCLDNGYAEQRNGLIKHHLLPTLNITRLDQLIKKFEKLIYFYNYERKQEALGWLSPVEFEQKCSSENIRPSITIYDRANKTRSKRT